MNSRLSLTFVLSSLAGLGVVAAAALTPVLPPVRAQAPAPAPRLDVVQAKALYSEKCSACHNLPDPQEKDLTRAQWQGTVNRMLTKYKASDSISPMEAAQIVDYLATFAPRPNRAGRGPQDPWATDAADVWTVAPSATRVFNFEAGPTLSGLSPLAAGAPGPAPVWRVVSDPTRPDGGLVKVSAVKPSAGRSALLVDKTDQGRNLDVRVRFQILSGHAAPAVGLAFGFQSPAAYSVLRYSAATSDLALIKIEGPTHTTLQLTALSLPPPGLPSAAAPTPGATPVAALAAPLAPGWHTLRLLVRDGQVRGWLDMTKRIAVADPAYSGGKVGLWTQGDTVASFDDWSIDLYDAPSSPQPPPAT